MSFGRFVTLNANYIYSGVEHKFCIRVETVENQDLVAFLARASRGQVEALCMCETRALSSFQWRDIYR